MTSIVNLVAAGMGVSMVPASMRQINSSGVIYRRIDDPAPKARMSLVYRENYQSASLSHLITLARKLSKEKKKVTA